jgi:hypothetical protein
MSLPTLFQFLTFSPGPFWLGLIVAPRNRGFQRAFDAYLWLLIAIFAVRAIPNVPTMIPLLSNPSFEAMQALFRTPEGFLSGWNHFIIGDLWFGRYIATDGHRHGISGWVRAPLILLTLYFGPLGLLAYLLLRALLRRIWTVGECVADASTTDSKPSTLT